MEIAHRGPRSYQLAPEGFKAVKRRLIRMPIVFTLTLGAFLAVMNFRPSEGWMFNLLIPLTVAFFLAVGTSIGVSSQIKAQRAAWESYDLVIYEDGIIRRQRGYPDIELRRDDVKRVVVSRWGLTVKGPSLDQMIFIPNALMGYAEVLEELRSWVSQTSEDKPAWRVATILAPTALAVTAMGAFMLSSDKRVVVPLGILLAIGLLWCFLAVRRSPHLDARTKQLSWMTLFVVVAVLLRTITMLAN
jgi:hypothetical protein